MKKYILILFASISVSAFSQQLMVNNEYLINKYSLSPAFAGSNNNFEVFASYRQNWLGIEGAPEKSRFDFNGMLTDKIGIGGDISDEKIGIFRNFGVNISYAYHTKLSETQALSFGASIGIAEKNIDLSTYTSEVYDPVITRNQVVEAGVFNAELGVNYQCKNMNVGISIPNLTESVIENGNGEVLFSQKRHYKIYATNIFTLNPSLQLEPYIIAQKSAASSLFYETALLLSLKKQIWLGLTYRKNGSISTSLGTSYKRFILNYSYEFSGNGMISHSSGTNEITLGFLLGKNNARIQEPILLKGKSSPPYQQWD